MDELKPGQPAEPTPEPTPPVEPPKEPVKVNTPPEPAPEPTPPAEPKEPAKEPATPPAEPATPPGEPKKEPEPPTFEVDGKQLTADELKAGYMRQKDYTQKTQDLAVDRKKLDTIKETIDPTPPLAPKEPTQPLTTDNLDRILTERDQRRDQETALKQEVTSLEKEFTGDDGRPKYVDTDVLKWQKESKKMYLNPKEAFEQMNKDALLDWEVKQRLSKAGKGTFQESGGGAGEVKLPEGKEAFIDKETGEEDVEGRKRAILESWEKEETGINQ